MRFPDFKIEIERGGSIIESHPQEESTHEPNKPNPSIHPSVHPDPIRSMIIHPPVKFIQRE